MKTPMPSPRGTNHERVFLRPGFGRRSAGACDAANWDQRDFREMGDVLDELQGWLQDKLSDPDDAAQLGEYILRARQELSGGGADGADWRDEVRGLLKRKGLGEDDINEAMRAASSLVGGSRGSGGRADDRRRPAMDARPDRHYPSAAAEASFDHMFPQARHIVVG